MMYFIFISSHTSRVIDENVRKMARNANLKTQIYCSKNISSFRAYNSKFNSVSRYYKLILLYPHHEHGKFMQNFTLHFSFIRNDNLILAIALNCSEAWR